MFQFKRSSEQENASNASGLGPQIEVWEGRTPPAYLRRREIEYLDIIFMVINLIFLNHDFGCSVTSCPLLKTLFDLFLQLESSSSEKTQAIVSDKMWSDKRCWSVEPNSKFSFNFEIQFWWNRETFIKFYKLWNKIDFHFVSN